MRDLADAFVKCLDNYKAAKQIYNISGERYVSFSGIANLCGQVRNADLLYMLHLIIYSCNKRLSSIQ